MGLRISLASAKSYSFTCQILFLLASNSVKTLKKSLIIGAICKIKWRGVSVVMSGARCRLFAYGSADAAAMLTGYTFLVPAHPGSINQANSKCFKWYMRCNHCKNHLLDDVNRYCQDMITWIKVDVRWTVNLPQRHQLAVYSRCVKPQPQRLSCRQEKFDEWYHEVLGIERMESLSTRVSEPK